MPSFYTVEPNIFNTLADILLHTEICIISHGTSKKHTLTTKFVNHSRVESLVWSMLHVTILLPRMWKWLLEYFKIFRLLNHTVSTLSHFFFYFCPLYGAETWTLRAADQKYLESFDMWLWRRMEKISWTDHVRNECYLESMSRGISYMK